jgi:hypothetical protein
MLKQKQNQDNVKQLGPLKEIDIKIKLPEALVDYINEVVIGENKEVEDLDQYCSEEVIRVMLTHLDNNEDTVLRNYTIPKALDTYYHREIMEKYCGWRR